MNKKRRRKALEGTVLAVGMSLSILTPVLAAYDPAPKAVQDHSYGQPQAATKEEISEMIASGIEAAIHCRESDGTWKIIKTNLDESHLAAVTVHGPDRDEAWISLNTTCFPEGYQEYSGLFDGQENARPIFRDFFKEDESQEQIFGLSMLMLYRNAAGKWETSSKENGIDLWCAAYLPHEELESASIEFHSDTTGKKYQIPLIEQTYDQFCLDENPYHGSQATLGVRLHLEEYEKKLSELTGSVVEFGGLKPELPASHQPKNRRRVTLKKDGNGIWTERTQGFDLTGFLTEEHTGISFIETDGKTPVSMHRLYNPNSGEHFYTASDNEKDFLVKAGWKDEGEGWKAPTASAAPVFRLYNENAGDHHYTLDEKERNALISFGWKDEGIGWYSDDEKSVPLYRQYNPNAKAGSHNYTPNRTEHDFLVSVGWNDEGIAWYGMN